MDIPYPVDTRAKGWRFELDTERIEQSDTWALATPVQRAWLLRLWMVAWQQTPCGSLPNNDALVAARLGMSSGEFEQHRAILFRGWSQADDGRLYHPVIVELVLEMLAIKSREARRKADYRARLKASNVPQLSRGTDTGRTRESGGSDDTGTGTSKRKPSCSPSASESAETSFATFWQQYPKKIAKPAALKAWKTLKPTGQTLVDLMAGLERQKASPDWQKEGGRYITRPETWLKDRRWEDEQPVSPTVTTPAASTTPPKPGDTRMRFGMAEVFDDCCGWVPA